MRSKNLKPSSKFVVSTSSEESSSSDRTMDDSKVIGTVTINNLDVYSWRDVGLHAGNEAGQFFKYPENVDVANKFLQYKKSLDGEWGHYVMNAGLWFRTMARPCGNIEHYQVPSLDQWNRSMDIGNDIDIAYYNGIGAEVVEEGFLCYLNQVVYGLSIPRVIARRPASICLDVIQAEPNPKVVADTSSLFDVLSREGNELNKVLEELGIRREMRLNSVVEKVQRAHQNRVMATSGSAYADVMEIPACDGVNLKAVEQEVLDLAMRDPIHLDTQIRSSISQLSVAWKLAAEVLKLAAADRDELVRRRFCKGRSSRREGSAERSVREGSCRCKEKVEDEAKKVVDIVVASRNKLIQAFYFWGLSREDVDLVLAGKYSKIIFPGDDASPVAEKSPAPPVADDNTEDEVVRLKGKVIEMEKALSRARDSINRTQQRGEVLRKEGDRFALLQKSLKDKRFVDESDKLEWQRSLLSLTFYFEAEVDSERGLNDAYLELLTERGIVLDPARVIFLAQEARNHHSIEAQRCLARARVSIIWGGVGPLPDELDFAGAKSNEDPFLQHKKGR
ncbi:hypothetical protein GIB67_033055 [Kingdonia uniflora]|uniref:Uncharacterized protein n=1 Tax=Kingdonia uniflora TaxID=39325 RepID=A0A7J7MYG0_9MAGN|nr:hypothetical protein GIB67_033055 [Kingdonia uniflora]